MTAEKPGYERFSVKARVRSFGYAFEGWSYVLRTQQNAWIHAVVSIAVFLVAI